ncbi:hypothetical protein HSBAA_17570 [Vreelandella sulfidaeris]|uniref:Pseudouridine synthase RsuA/RluA-like domain-containing protein n=1 Tax=Vreelandella sulfidaeris TaxID=115553 RepID=A0A455U7J1_9GAMM|nr:hypothetical protein HSBAA_17570 [Halomonas sulfidaeris]
MIHRISHPRHKQPKTYWAQLEGHIDDAALKALRQGIVLKDGPTQPAKARRIAPPVTATRQPAIDPKRHPSTSWLELTISEGRNRQVRRMTAHVGFPTLRLIRMAIGPWRLDDLMPGEWRKETLHAPGLPIRTPDNEHGPPPNAGSHYEPYSQYGGLCYSAGRTLLNGGGTARWTHQRV